MQKSPVRQIGIVVIGLTQQGLQYAQFYSYVILSEMERSGMKSKDLRSYSYICSRIGAKILRLRASPYAQDDT